MTEYNFSIPGYELREKVLIFSRAHPISFMGRLVFLTLLFLLPFMVISLRLIELQASLLIVCVYYLLWLDIAFIEWVKFYYDFIVVTESQLIYVNQRGIFDRAIYQCHLSQIEESTGHIKGVLPNLFSYGSVEMQTAGPQENIMINNIPNPFEISERVMKLHDEAVRRR